MSSSWENSIIIKSTKSDFTVLPPVHNFIADDHFIETSSLDLPMDINEYIKKDVYPLPVTDDREGYHDQRHYDYWLSGIDEYIKIKKASSAAGLDFEKEVRILDFGCASGRVLRHFVNQEAGESWGCDINEDHVNWCNRFLGDNAKVFQNTSLPHLQIEDNFFDLVYCLSVFTHIEEFETSWLCELRRIIKKGGIAYITIHDETSWNNMPKDWGVGHAVLSHPSFNTQWLKDGFPNEKFVSRWLEGKSYSSNVFYKIDYIHRVWAKFFTIAQIIPMGSNYQTVLVLKNNKH